VQARARVQLGTLSPDDVVVELYSGRLDSQGNITAAESSPMRVVRAAGNGAHLYESSASAWHASGLHGYTIRVLPHHRYLNSPFVPGLITWASADGVKHK
jgi:glycogen phosphorylase